MNKSSTCFKAYDGHMNNEYWNERRKSLGLPSFQDMSVFCKFQCEELPLNFDSNSKQD